MKDLIKSANAKIKKLDAADIAFTKLAVISFTLMIAKLWQPILSLEWYLYAIIWIVLAIKHLSKFFKK